jgi:hypothetical protein
MNPLTFPTGSIGALLYNDVASARNAPIASPREFAAGADPARTEGGDERWVHVAMAATVVLVIVTIAYFIL